MPPLVCTVHLGRWGGDPLCKECRTLTGRPRHREPVHPLRLLLRWLRR